MHRVADYRADHRRCRVVCTATTRFAQGIQSITNFTLIPFLQPLSTFALVRCRRIQLLCQRSALSVFCREVLHRDVRSRSKQEPVRTLATRANTRLTFQSTISPEMSIRLIRFSVAFDRGFSTQFFSDCGCLSFHAMSYRQWKDINAVHIQQDTGTGRVCINWDRISRFIDCGRDDVHAQDRGE